MPLRRELSWSQRCAPREGERERRRDVLARLREEIRRLEHRPGRREGIVACGLAEVDDVTPGGGFPRGALSELRGGPASGKTAIALSLLAALSADEIFAWVDGRGELYPPAAAARGVDLARLLVVRPPLSPPGYGLQASGHRTARGTASDEAWSLQPEAFPGRAREPSFIRGAERWQAALWAAEALLASGAFAAVAIDIATPRASTGADVAARRLQTAAERGGAIGLWLSTPSARIRIPAAVRLEVASAGGRIVARRAAGGEGARGRGRAA